MAEPTFLFGIGAQKAGTTWLYDYFSQHPQVHVPDVKEMHFFDVKWLPESRSFLTRRRRILERREQRAARRRARGEKVPPKLARLLRRSQTLIAMHEAPEDDWSFYREAMLAERTTEACVADMTPAYCNLDVDHLRQMMAGFAPAKILFLLRDPVERMWSQIKMHCASLENTDAPMTPDEAITSMLQGGGRSFLLRGQMDVTLANLAQLPPEAVKVMFYERLFNDDQIADLCDFLGIDFVPGDYGARVNAGKTTKMTQAQRATLRWLNGPTYRAIYDAMGDDIPSSWDMSALTAARPAHLSVSEIHDQILQGRTT